MSLTRSTMSAIRFGYGIRPGEQAPDGADALLAQLDDGAQAKLRFPAEGIDGRYATYAEFARRAANARSPDKEKTRANMKPIRREIIRLFGADQHARVAQSVLSPYGFQERLATFWSDHFSVSAKKQRTMYLLTPLYEAEALRPNLAGPFDELLHAAILHPAMLIYLDQVRSNGPNSRRGKNTGKGLNENLGRELLELHTLGVDGGYKQDDVRAAALVLTGLTVDRKTGRTEFKRQMAEPGPLTFMGKSYGSAKRSIADVEAMLIDIAARPQTAHHICRKLVIHFVSDKPPEALVAAMVDAWRASNGNLRDVYAAMLANPAAWDNAGEKARQPYDYIVAGLRALEIPESALAVPKKHDPAAIDDAEAPAAAAVAATAQNDMKPEMAATADLSEEEREEQAESKAPKKRDRLRPPVNPISVRAIGRLGQPVWLPASPAGSDESFATWISSSQITGRIEWAQRVASQHAGRLDPNALLKEVLRDAARDDTIKVVGQAPSRVAGTALVLASPEFNRR
ncbi:DUF1800 domain-containing protein [Rhizobium sp. KVB221]|uniref:DUF1800 domain-containing protein n=1 Tax=Rhizobium setariae TaxID=2801340 RepID=A0A937CPX6_9HYPH|nr:DUF1800 domain-containing protein [Rhizobium setariae]MBL0373103.1 DUF1800 domain-containing protein [Rhizobium setariae]